MGNRKKTLHTLIEQTARMLRSAANPLIKKKRSIQKQSPPSMSNKIAQIAKMLRLETDQKHVKKKKTQR